MKMLVNISGISMDLSSDGTILGIGATGIHSDNDDVGAVFVYSLSKGVYATKNLKITDNIKHDNAFYSDNTIEFLTNTWNIGNYK